MLRDYPAEHEHISQEQIYLDLSEIIKVFKNLLNLMDNIANGLSKYQSVQNLIEQLKSLLNSMQAMIKTYYFVVSDQSQHKNTVHRFICRIVQSISSYKLKLQSLPYFSTLNNYVKDIQNNVLSYQNDRNLGFILKKIQIIAFRFCARCVKVNEGVVTKSQLDNQKAGSPNNSPLDYESSQRQMQNMSDLGLHGVIARPKQKANIMQSKSQSNLNKLIISMNNRYKTLACLQIDQNAFKQTFYRSRDANLQLYQESFLRNSHIQKQLLRYSKHFSQYLNRRDLKIYRKNKFIDQNQRQQKPRAKINTQKQPSRDDILSYNFMRRKTPSQNRRHINKKNTYEQESQYDTSKSHFYVQQSNLSVSKQQTYKSKNQQYITNIYQNLSYLDSNLLQNVQQRLLLPIRSSNFSNFAEEQDSELLRELSRRKKNLQLKKIDISLSNFNGNNQKSVKNKDIQSLDPQIQHKKQQIKQKTDERINATFRRNFTLKKQQKQQKQLSKRLQQLSITPTQSNQNSNLASKHSPSTSKPNQFKQYSPNKSNKFVIKLSNKNQIFRSSQTHKEKYRTSNVCTQGEEDKRDEKTNLSLHTHIQHATNRNFRRIKIQHIQEKVNLTHVQSNYPFYVDHI